VVVAWQTLQKKVRIVVSIAQIFQEHKNLKTNDCAGVVNHKGQVYSNTTGTDVYQNLYVADSAILPTSLGVFVFLNSDGNKKIDDKFCNFR
jgi:predicted class III extradiol MEMO1 family dioxygenase